MESLQLGNQDFNCTVLRQPIILHRHIDDAGGLDSYLLRTPDRLLMSDVGSDLKFRIGLVYKQRWHDLEQQKQQQRRLQSVPQRRPQQQLGHAAAGAGTQSVSMTTKHSEAAKSVAGLDALRRQQADAMQQSDHLRR